MPPNLDFRERKAWRLQRVAARTRLGDSAAEIAVELRCSARTVVRYRAELKRETR